MLSQLSQPLKFAGQGQRDHLRSPDQLMFLFRAMSHKLLDVLKGFSVLLLFLALFPLHPPLLLLLLLLLLFSPLRFLLLLLRPLLVRRNLRVALF